MKKKILALSLAVALLAIVVSGTLAYFSDTDEVTNTFTVGSVKIEIFENNVATDKDTMEFTKPLTPVVNADPSQDESYIHKAVKVQNTGLNEAYIRTCLAIPSKLVDYLELDVSEDWVERPDLETTVIKEGIEYTVYTYDFGTEVAPNAFTPDLLKGVYLASDVDLEEDANGSLWFVKKANGEITKQSGFLAHTKTANGYQTNIISVLVASQAIQAQGFANATDALNTGFPQNPWAQ